MMRQMKKQNSGTEIIKDEEYFSYGVWTMTPTTIRQLHNALEQRTHQEQSALSVFGYV